MSNTLSTKAAVRAAANKINVTIIDSGDEIESIAPIGQVFNCTDTHMLVLPYRSSLFEDTPKAEAWGLVLEDLKLGLCNADKDHECAHSLGEFKSYGQVIARSTDHLFLQEPS